MVKVFTDLEVEEVSLVSDPANPKARVSLLKARNKKSADPDRNDNIVDKAEGTMCRLCDTKVADADRYCRNCGAPFYKAAHIKDEDMNKNEKTEPVAAPAAPAPADGDVAKALETERAEREALAKRLDEQAKENEALKKSLAEQSRTMKLANAKDRVEKTMKGIPGDGLADKLVELAEANPELAKAFEEFLVKASALIEQGEAFKQASANVTKAPAGSTVQERVDVLVKAAIEANPKLTKAQAEAQVWSENRNLYAEYEDERKAALRK